MIHFSNLSLLCAYTGLPLALVFAFSSGASLFKTHRKLSNCIFACIATLSFIFWRVTFRDGSMNFSFLYNRLDIVGPFVFFDHIVPDGFDDLCGAVHQK